MSDADKAATRVNVAQVSATQDSKITKVCLYSGLAEVTRIFKATLKDGDNKIVVSGLPNVLLPESLRVEGRGPCTIHEVSISEIPRDSPTTSPELTSLEKDKEQFKKSLARCKKCISSIEKFQSSLNAKHVPADRLGSVGKEVEVVAAKLDDKLIQLEEKLDEIEKAIQEERKTLGEPKDDDKLRKRVSITIIADKACEVEVVLVYGVFDAAWDAAYDIYVKTDRKDKQVSLVYKGAILQNTGEAWEDVSLTLETVTPTFGLAIPELTPWWLSVYNPAKFYTHSASYGRGGFVEESCKMLLAEENPAVTDGGEMAKRVMRVASKGDISASFAVPGLISVPSDGASHNVTVCELVLDSVMSWVSVPKKNARAHLTAKIKNDSEFTLLKGVASVYVDGSFISRSDVPTISPQETFDCPLGIDPSIRITYHPRSKKINRSGFTRRTCSYIIEQRITIVNTKATSSLSSIKIHDQIPVSEDARIAVRLTNPPLQLPTVNKKGVVQPVTPVFVKNEKDFRVIAKWDEMDEDGSSPENGGIDLALVGKSGKLNWVSEEMSGQSKLHLVLSWEVVYPYGTDIMGLDN